MIDHMTPRDVPKTLPGTRPQDIESTQCEFARGGVPKTDVFDYVWYTRRLEKQGELRGSRLAKVADFLSGTNF